VKAVIAWWDLPGTGQTVASLRESLRREGTEAWASVEGLRHKFWISDPAAQRWGAVMVWDSEEAAEAAAQRGLPPNRAAELIGSPPSLRLVMEVEAAVEGLCTTSTTKEERTWP
jgi:trans-2,3-dihydro-3-hydroxyanthranilate isomerase